MIFRHKIRSPGAESRRNGLANAFLAQECPDCGAVNPAHCDLDIIAEAVRIDPRPHQLILHTSRIRAAIGPGAVSRELVLAQFSGAPPAALLALPGG